MVSFSESRGGSKETKPIFSNSRKRYWFDFMFLLVDYGKVLWSFANELQQNSDGFSKEDMF